MTKEAALILAEAVRDASRTISDGLKSIAKETHDLDASYIGVSCSLDEVAKAIRDFASIYAEVNK